MNKKLDSIYEVYMGDETNEFTRQSRERIHWICEQATGNYVLDVGCSQGISSILSGRKGLHVFGLDIESDSISFANEMLKNESTLVQNLVKFEVGDFLQYDFGTQQYDSIFMTEILEHIVDIMPFIEKAQMLLIGNGTLVVTVPFGINDFWDHKDTYYVSKLYEALSIYFDIVDIEFFTKWIGFICKHQDVGNKKISIDLVLLKDTEKAFYRLERELVNRSNMLAENLKVVNEKYKLALDNYETSKQWLNDKNKKIKSLQNNNENLQNELQLANQRYKTAQDNYETSKQCVIDKEDRINILDNEKQKLQLEYDSLLERYKVELRDISKDYNLAIDTLHQLKEQINESNVAYELLHKEYQKDLLLASEDYNTMIAVLDEVNRKLHLLETRNEYLKSEAAEYRRKLSLITDTWWGKIGIKVYKRLKRMKAKLCK